jgi:hypothetical protein
MSWAIVTGGGPGAGEAGWVAYLTGVPGCAQYMAAPRNVYEGDALFQARKHIYSGERRVAKEKLSQLTVGLASQGHVIISP